MSGYDGPGDGWREVSGSDDLRGVRRIFEVDENDIRRRAWVPVEPMPALPSESNTVIEVTFRSGNIQTLTREERDMWWVRGHAGGWYSTEDLMGSITGFEVLAEPRSNWDDLMIFKDDLAQHDDQVRRVTAKSVLHEVKMGLTLHGNVDPEDLYQIGKQFGVES